MFVSDVIIVGAGPGGLTLGAELASRGISCKIYEKRLARSLSSRAIGLLPYTLELLETRNLADMFINKGLIIEQVPLGNGQYLNLNHLNHDTKFPFMLSIPQNKTEAILEDWALEMGVEIVKGVELVDLEQNGNEVYVSVTTQDGIWKECAKYVVGSDGRNSLVRSLLGIHSKEKNYDKVLMHGDVKLHAIEKNAVFAKISKQGMIAAFPLPNNYHRLLILDHKKMNRALQKEVDLDDFKESAERLAQKNLEIVDPLWLSSFNTQQKHASTYRVNRVFLLGDAAHTHIPAGGQGLQSAIEDAFNLGWKLANSLNNKPNESLLNTYESERKQIATQAMVKSRWLFRYEISTSIWSYILRKCMARIALIPIFQKQILRSLSGLNNYYKLSSKAQHHLIGRSVLNNHLYYHSGKTIEIRELLKQRKVIFLSSSGIYDFNDSYHLYHIDEPCYVHGVFYEDQNIRSMIIRPDGIVAWAK